MKRKLLLLLAVAFATTASAALYTGDWDMATPAPDIENEVFRGSWFTGVEL